LAEPFDPHNPYFQSLGFNGVGSKRWASRFSEEQLNADNTITATFSTGPRVYWNTLTGEFEGLQLKVAPGNGTSLNVRYFARNSHVALEFYDSSVKLFNPDYTRVSVEVEMWEVNVLQVNGRWKPTGVGTMTPTWTYAQTDDCVNVTRTQTVAGTGQFVLTYTLRAGQLLKHTAVYTSYVGGTFEVVMTWNGIASAHLKTSVGEELTITGETHRVVQSFSAGADLNHNVVYEDLTSVYGSVLKDVVFNTYAGGMKADIMMGDYTLAANGVLTIDPTTSTYNVPTSNSDGFIEKTDSADYPTTQGAATGTASYQITTVMDVGQSKPSNYDVRRCVIRFETPLPATAIISAARLCLGGVSDGSTTDFILRLQKWTEASDGISTADYNGFDGTSYDDGLWSSSVFSTVNYNNITISNFNLITPEGYTDIFLRSKEDIDVSAPINNEYLQFNSVTGTKQPLLIITYTYSAPAEDYVDLDSSNVDSSADIGTSSSFAAQKATDRTNDTLTEANTNTATTTQYWVDGFDSTTTGWTTGGSSPYLSTVEGTNIISTATNGAVEKWFTFADTTKVTVNSVRLCVYAKTAGNDGFSLYLYDGSATKTVVTNQALSGSYAWWNYTITTDFSTTTKINAAKLEVDYWYTGGKTTTTVDAALISVTGVDTNNYKLDLEFQFTNVNYTRTNEQLCIKTGPFNGGSAENIKLYWWATGNSTWVLKDAAMDASAWNNYTVALTAATFTIRVIGATETTDTVQNTWKIDGNLLHTWETSGALQVGAATITLTFAKSAARLMAFSKTDTITFTFGKAGAKLIEVGKPAAKAFTITDSAGRVLEAPRAGAQTLTFTSAAARLGAWLRVDTIAFTLGKAASKSFEASIAAAQALVFTSSAARLMEFLKAVTQGFTLSSSTARLIEFVRGVTQALTLTSAAGVGFEWVKAAAQALTFAGSAAREIEASIGAAVSLTLTNAGTRLAEFSRAATQTITGAFNAAKLIEMTRAAAQSFTASFSAAMGFDVGRAASQSLTMVSAAARLIEVGVNAAQGFTLTNAAGRLAETFRAASQGLTLTSGVGTLFEWFRVATSSLVFTPNAGAIIEVLKAVSQAISFAISSGTLSEFTRIVTQTITTSWAATYEWIQGLTEFTRDAAISLTLSLSASPLGDYLRGITQALTLTSNVARLGEWFRDVKGYFTLAKAATKLIEVGAAASQSITLSISAARGLIVEMGATITLTLANSATRLAEVSAAASQGLSFSFNAARGIVTEVAAAISLTLANTATRLAEMSGAASQSIAFTVAGTRGIIVDVASAISLTFGNGASRLLEAERGVTQALVVALNASRLAEFSRAASQAIITNLYVSRLIEMLYNVTVNIGITAEGLTNQVVSALVGLSISFGNGAGRLIEVTKTVTQGFTTAFSGGRLYEALRDAAQGLTFTNAASNLMEYLRGVTQDITLSLSAAANSVLSFIRDATLSITTTFTAERLLDALRDASQGFALTNAAGRLAEMLRDATQGLTFSTLTDRWVEFTRDATQVINWLGDAARSIILAPVEYTRAVTQAITVSLNANRLIEVLVDAAQTLTFTWNAIGTKLATYLANVNLTLKLYAQGLPFDIGAIYTPAQLEELGGGATYYILGVAFFCIIIVLLFSRRG
jgi:hypothetical protein